MIGKIITLLVQILSWLVLLALERNIGLPIFSTIILLVFVSQLGRINGMAVMAVGAGLIYAVWYGLSLSLGVLLIGMTCCGFVYTGGHFTNFNRRLLIADLLLCIVLGWLIKLQLTPTILIYHLSAYIIAVLGVYLIRGWKIRSRSLQISRRFQHNYRS